jgi:hypothetical protein
MERMINELSVVCSDLGLLSRGGWLSTISLQAASKTGKE